MPVPIISRDELKKKNRSEATFIFAEFLLIRLLSAGLSITGSLKQFP